MNEKGRKIGHCSNGQGCRERGFAAKKTAEIVYVDVLGGRFVWSARMAHKDGLRAIPTRLRARGGVELRGNR
jgi:hypothetical protein